MASIYDPQWADCSNSNPEPVISAEQLSSPAGMAEWSKGSNDYRRKLVSGFQNKYGRVPFGFQGFPGDEGTPTIQSNASPAFAPITPPSQNPNPLAPIPPQSNPVTPQPDSQLNQPNQFPLPNQLGQAGQKSPLFQNTNLLGYNWASLFNQ
jgi:hypothetical protein